jgi:hypothetical protein
MALESLRVRDRPASRAAARALPAVASLLAVALMGLSGCDSKGAAPGGDPTDADFAVCSMTPAVRYVPGMSVLSTTGAYRASLESAGTTVAGGQVSGPAIGFATFSVAVTSVADAGSDAGPAGDAAASGSVPGGLTMTAPKIPGDVPANPYMPQHMHGGSTAVEVTPQGGGLFSVADVNFIMGGYWQLYLDLVSASGTTDRVTFLLCIPDD